MTFGYRGFRALPFLLAFLIVLSGCDLISGDDEITGTYQLKSLSGGGFSGANETIQAGEPIEIDFLGVIITIAITGTLTLRSDDTFTATTATRTTAEGESETETNSATGTFEVDGDRVTLSGVDDEEEAYTATATVDGDRLTMTNEGVTLVYEK